MHPIKHIHAHIIYLFIFILSWTKVDNDSTIENALVIPSKINKTKSIIVQIIDPSISLVAVG